MSPRARRQEVGRSFSDSMAAATGGAHRAGQWKQANKTHKTGRHRSKGQLHKEAQGMFHIRPNFVAN